MIFLSLMLLSDQLATSWYGPAVVDFDLKTSGNPFDFEENDVRVEFSGPGGTKQTRLGYFSQGKWHAVLTSVVPGKFSGKVLLNGKQSGVSVQTSVSEVVPDGFVRLKGVKGFRLDNGKPYWPIGFNLAWLSAGKAPWEESLQEMGKLGLNWSRIWANHWDGKNPFWVKGDQLKFDESALDKWDSIIKGAERGGIKFQFVLFHHGPWSSRVNSNWGENPMNKKNGGFLDKPADFFTSAKAKKVARAWLRYAVARYGHSPSIMSWELFNEVEWTDPNYENKQSLLGDWHREMALILRDLDPYDHLLTTSSELHLPIYDVMDYYQPHGYPNSIRNLITSAEVKSDKPFFFGEIGPANLGGGVSIQRSAIREGIWSALVMGHAGSAQFWSWDLVYRQNLKDEFVFARKILNESQILNAQTRKFEVGIDSPTSPLKIQPSGGWTAFKTYDFMLPKDASGLGGIPAFFQGKAHPEMRAKPVVLRVNTQKQCEMRVSVAEISSTGGNLVARIGGREVARLNLAAKEDVKGKVLVVPIPAGSVEVSLDNDGADWLKIQEFEISGVGRLANPIATGSSRSCLIHITKPLSTASFASALSNLPLSNGTYAMAIYDLDAKTTSISKVNVVSGSTTSLVNFSASDAVITLRR